MHDNGGPQCASLPEVETAEPKPRDRIIDDACWPLVEMYRAKRKCRCDNREDWRALQAFQDRAPLVDQEPCLEQKPRTIRSAARPCGVDGVFEGAAS